MATPAAPINGAASAASAARLVTAAAAAASPGSSVPSSSGSSASISGVSPSPPAAAANGSYVDSSFPQSAEDIRTLMLDSARKGELGPLIKAVVSPKCTQHCIDEAFLTAAEYGQVDVSQADNFPLLILYFFSLFVRAGLGIWCSRSRTAPFD